MKQFTIYIGTDGAPPPAVAVGATVQAFASEYLRAYTMHEAVGAWEGTKETTYVVTVLTGGGNRVWDFARAVRRELNQQCVLVTEQDVTVTFVTNGSRAINRPTGDDDPIGPPIPDSEDSFDRY